MSVDSKRFPKLKAKILIRNLPANLTEEAILSLINKNFEGKYDYYHFEQGKQLTKGSISARLYLNFKDPNTVFEFFDRFNGHTFVNSKGIEEKALVEYAPYQKIPKKKKKKDPREGTIGQDPDYKLFLEELEKPVTNLPSAEVQYEKRMQLEKQRIESLQGETSLIISPLVAELQTQKKKFRPQNRRKPKKKINNT